MADDIEGTPSVWAFVASCPLLAEARQQSFEHLRRALKHGNAIAEIEVHSALEYRISNPATRDWLMRRPRLRRSGTRREHRLPAPDAWSPQQRRDPRHLLRL